MSKIKFEAVVRDRGSLIKIGSINSAKLVPLIGKEVIVTVTEVKPSASLTKRCPFGFRNCEACEAYK